MREAFEAVAEFLARHGGLDEYDAVLRSMEHMGWFLDENHAAQWRVLFSVLRAELSDAAHSLNYVFVYERLLQLYVRIPEAMCRNIFNSKLVLHIIVERFAAAYVDFDADVFRAEREVLYHAEDIYSTCALIQEKLYRGDESSPLGAFLQEFRDLFDNEDPKSSWEALRERHLLPEVVFRRDMKRLLWSIEEEVLGKTQIEDLLAASQGIRPSEKRFIIPRRILESRFTGTGSEWRDLADVVSVRGLSAELPVEDRRESLLGARAQQQRMNDVVSETPPGLEQEERVWSARLPIATPGGDSDSASEEAENAIDDVVRQEKPTQRSPGRARKSQPEPRPRSSSANQPVHQSPVRQRQRTRRRRQHQRVQRKEDSEEEIDLDDDDDFFEAPSRAADTPSTTKKTRKRWTNAEVDALIKGIKRFGGKWKQIKDTYPDVLSDRSNVDIKDKYRNLLKYKRIPPIQ